MLYEVITDTTVDTGKKILIAGLLGAGLLFLTPFLSGNGGWQGDGIPPYTIAEGAVRGSYNFV